MTDMLSVGLDGWFTTVIPDAVAPKGMIRAYLNEDVVRHPFSSMDEWNTVTFGSDVTVKARVNHRNIVVTNVQGEEKVSRTQILLAPNQTVDAKDEWTVDDKRLNVVETKKNQDFVVQLKELRLV